MGSKGLEVVGPERLREIEPYAAGIKAIFSPNTGIVDFVGVAHAYARSVQERGGEIVVGHRVTSHHEARRLRRARHKASRLVAGLDLRSRRRMSSPALDCNPTR